jgi:serine protease Do
MRKAVLLSALVLTAAAGRGSRPDELVFRLQYVGSDYGAAVQGGRVVDAAEYEELLALSKQSVERYAELRPHGPARADLLRLGDLIGARASWETVRSLSRNLASRIGDELDVVPFPMESPDLESGRELYRESCAPCHGVVGAGDGWAAPSMSPRPTSFREPLMAMRSPHEVYGSASFGNPGTAMPAYGEGLQPRELWDIAFFVMTLRDGFDATPPVEIVPLSLKEIAAQSDEELLKRLRTSRPGAQARELDYYRSGFRRTGGAVASARSAPADDGASVAETLERTFAHVAEGVFPTVVGVSVYEKTGEPGSGSPREGWTVGDPEDSLYPGYRRVTSGTGFLVAADGDVLTFAGAMTRPGSSRASDLIDVELPGNIHCRARLIGLEPTIDLAVLGIVPPVPVRAAVLGDSDTVRIGHWAIAVGDPPGPEKYFVPGTIGARPERECYQEHRTKTLLQSSAAMETGGFGGPLVNIRGEVIGLTIPGDAGAAPIAPGGRPVNALPINLAMTIYRALKVKESERSPWIGISVLELGAALRARIKSPPLTGIYIDDVFDLSPASRAGIRVGDVLTKMDEQPILGVSDFQSWLYLLGIDRSVTLEIVRGGAKLRKQLTIEARPGSALTR